MMDNYSQGLDEASHITEENSWGDLFKQGAEARLYRTLYDGKAAVVKERFPKKYRHPDLDSRLTKQRIKREEKCIERCQKAGIAVPELYFVNMKQRVIIMEDIKNSVPLKSYLIQLYETSTSIAQLEIFSICLEIGTAVGNMHKHDIIHGDLTTSNILIQEGCLSEERCGNTEHSPQSHNAGDMQFTWKLFFIDFGLSYVSPSAEDKAVDLYVLERALSSAHSEISTDCFKKIMEAYEQNCGEREKIIKKLEEVRSRGRKRTMVG